MQRFLFVSTVLICCAFYSHINGLPIIVGGQPVFKNLTQTQQAELHSILFNSNATRGSIKTGVRKWVQAQQNPTLQQAYEKHQQLKEEWKKLFIEVHNERVSKLSNEAKDLDSKLMAIWQDEKLTIGQTCHQINNLITTAPDFVVKELFREIRKCTRGDPDHVIQSMFS